MIHPPKAQQGDAVAVVAPSYAAPALFPAIHEQAMRRLTEVTGLIPVEYPTTRRDATPQDRARDLNAAFADPDVRAVMAVLGGDDQIQVIPHMDPGLAVADPKPFFGYSDNTNLLNWLWTLGIAGFHGGATQLHLGTGPGLDPCHEASLRAALFTGEQLEITEPGQSEDRGRDWNTPEALTHNGDREPTEPWTWAGPERTVTGPTWGGCIEVLQWILTAGRFPPDSSVLDGGVLLLETSEELISATEFERIVRSLGERGVLTAVDAVVVARAASSNHAHTGTSDQRAAHRAEQRDTAVRIIGHYNPDAVVCIGVPFGHTRPQWILPYGGPMTVDGATHTITADYR